MGEKEYLSKDIRETKEKELLGNRKRLSSLEEVKNLYQAKLDMAEKEIVLKQKAPLPLKPEYQFEELPEWKEHMAKAWEIAIKDNMLKVKAEIFQTDMQIELVSKEVERLEGELKNG